MLARGRIPSGQFSPPLRTRQWLISVQNPHFDAAPPFAAVDSRSIRLYAGIGVLLPRAGRLCPRGGSRCNRFRSLRSLRVPSARRSIGRPPLPSSASALPRTAIGSRAIRAEHLSLRPGLSYRSSSSISSKTTRAISATRCVRPSNLLDSLHWPAGTDSVRESQFHRRFLLLAGGSDSPSKTV